MNEPPRELQSIGLDAAVAIVGTVRRRAWVDVTLGAFTAVAAASLALFAGGWLVGAVTACVVFPVVARLSRRTQRWWLRADLARLDGDTRARLVGAAWDKASPGQRAALQMILKNQP